MGLIIGIDDAGRGPVIGPMVLTGVLSKPSDEVTLKSWGAKDSKLLTPLNRRILAKKIKDNYIYHQELATPAEIDDSTNLNYLEAIKVAMIINKLTEKIKEPVKVYIDCPSVNINAWTEDVRGLLKNPKKIKLISEHKSDALHPIVSAASIIAKERREDELFKLKQELKVDFGSGYPSDPKTKDFLFENHENPKYAKIIRFSWKTIKNLKGLKTQKKLF